MGKVLDFSEMMSFIKALQISILAKSGDPVPLINTVTILEYDVAVLKKLGNQ